jgi:uncharacterized protein (DUF58 family)
VTAAAARNRETPARDEAALLPARTLERLGGLEIIHRYVVEGFVAGLHRSVYRGAGDEFARHRAYQQGDDVRRIDWRLYARSDRLHVREYREESNLQSYLLLDASLSMGFADEDGITKLRYASFVAAALAYLMLGAGDAVGLASYGAQPVLHLPPRNRRGVIQEILLRLERLRAEGQGGAAAALDRVGDALRRRGRVILLSDLLDEDDGRSMLDAVGRLRARGDEVIIMRPLTPVELGESSAGSALYFDPEHPRRERPAVPAADPGYASRVQEYYAALRDRLGEQGAEYVPLSTADPVEHALTAWVRTRQRS